MGIFLITILVLVLGIVFLLISEYSRYSCDTIEVFGILFSLLGGIGVFVSGIIAAASPDVNYFNSQYEKVLSDIDLVNYADTVNVRFVSDLEKEVKDVNNTIADNREYEGTFWLGWYYSAKIANYEYLEVPEFKNIKYNY